MRGDLGAGHRDFFDVVAFTHFEDDHVCGALSFFWLEHASKYQAAGRIKIAELWVPAWAITVTKKELCKDGNFPELTRFGGRFTAWVSSRLLYRCSGCCGDAFMVHRVLVSQG